MYLFVLSQSEFAQNSFTMVLGVIHFHCAFNIYTLNYILACSAIIIRTDVKELHKCQCITFNSSPFIWLRISLSFCDNPSNDSSVFIIRYVFSSKFKQFNLKGKRRKLSGWVQHIPKYREIITAKYQTEFEKCFYRLLIHLSQYSR